MFKHFIQSKRDVIFRSLLQLSECCAGSNGPHTVVWGLRIFQVRILTKRAPGGRDVNLTLRRFHVPECRWWGEETCWYQWCSWWNSHTLNPDQANRIKHIEHLTFTWLEVAQGVIFPSGEAPTSKWYCTLEHFAPSASPITRAIQAQGVIFWDPATTQMCLFCCN